MEKYEPAELEIILFVDQDVVTASEGGDTDMPWL